MFILDSMNFTYVFSYIQTQYHIINIYSFDKYSMHDYTISIFFNMLVLKDFDEQDLERAKLIGDLTLVHFHSIIIAFSVNEKHLFLLSLLLPFLFFNPIPTL